MASNPPAAVLQHETGNIHPCGCLKSRKLRSTIDLTNQVVIPIWGDERELNAQNPGFLNEPCRLVGRALCPVDQPMCSWAQKTIP